MLLDFGRLLLGGLGLYFGAEWLISSAAALARRLGVPPLAVGMTIVAYGTSAPELTVSVAAALEGSSAIALGNVIGSNIANIGLILGITALMSPPLVEATIIRREVPVLFLSALAVPVVMWDGVLGRVEGSLLIAGAIAFTIFALRTAKQDPAFEVEVEQEEKEIEGSGSPLKLAAVGLAGLGVLVAGGDFFVDGAVGLARAFGMSERIVGLTIVAVGTSLPEMAASLVATLRGHSSIAIGNVVGSNIFNVLFILGATAMVKPITGSLAEMRLDIAAMLVMTVAAALFLRSARHIVRAEGAALVAGYALFIGLLVAGG